MTTIDLAMVGNGMFGALVDQRGRFVWCCLDSFDGDPVFNCLVNNNSDKTGFYDVILDDCENASQTYEPSSNVLKTMLSSSGGDEVEIRDFVPRFVNFDRVFHPFQLFRIIKRTKGDPRITVRIRPTFHYNSTDGYQTRGSQHVRFCGPKHAWRVTTNMPIRRIHEELPFLLSDDPVIIVFGSDESFTNSLRSVASEFEHKTSHYWKQWCRSLALPVEFQEVVMRSAMTLAMLQSEDSGGILTTISMGLPLGPLAPSSRDSRVCRLLDECLALPVLRELGLLDVCRKFLTFAKQICYQDEQPQHSYNTCGDAQGKKREWAPYLAGYRGMGEVYSGGSLLEDLPQDLREEESGWYNSAVINGLLAITLVHAFFDVRISAELCTPKLCEKLENFAHEACEAFSHRCRLFSQSACSNVDAAGRSCLPRGAGFFDDDAFFFRHDEQEQVEGTKQPQSSGGTVHTLTSVLCWAAADRLHRIAMLYLNDAAKASIWQNKAMSMHQEICKHAWNSQRGAFTTFWGGEKVGPSVLRLVELGFLSAEDARFRGTLRAFEADADAAAVCVGVFDGDLPVEGQDVPIAMSQTAVFTSNTLLWYCEALRSTGATAQARQLLEAILRCSRHRGMLPEAIDLRSGELWGNSPCTPALLSLLRVASRLSRSWREV